MTPFAVGAAPRHYAEFVRLWALGGRHHGVSEVIGQATMRTLGSPYQALRKGPGHRAGK